MAKRDGKVEMHCLTDIITVISNGKPSVSVRPDKEREADAAPNHVHHDTRAQQPVANMDARMDAAPTGQERGCWHQLLTMWSHQLVCLAALPHCPCRTKEPFKLSSERRLGARRLCVLGSHWQRFLQKLKGTHCVTFALPEFSNNSLSLSIPVCETCRE